MLVINARTQHCFTWNILVINVRTQHCFTWNILVIDARIQHCFTWNILVINARIQHCFTWNMLVIYYNITVCFTWNILKMKFKLNTHKTWCMILVWVCLIFFSESLHSIRIDWCKTICLSDIVCPHGLLISIWFSTPSEINLLLYAIYRSKSFLNWDKIVFY